MATAHYAATPRPAAFGWGTALIVAAAALLSAALLLFVVRDPLFVAAFGAGVVAVGGLVALHARLASPAVAEEQLPNSDIALLRAATDSAALPIAITDSDDRLVCANTAYAQLFGGYVEPLAIELDEPDRATLAQALRSAKR